MSQNVKNIDRLLTMFDQLTKKYLDDEAERALYLLLKKYKDELPSLESYNDYSYFHKAFRQIDVIDSQYMDMVIYHLLHHSVMFWVICEEIFNGTDHELEYLTMRKKR